MNNLFKTNEVNLKQAKAIIKAYGVCYLHADGNMFTEESDSDFRKDYSNPKAEAAKYRVKFTSVDQVPATLEELEKLFLDSKNKELNEAARPEAVSKVKTFSVDEDEASEAPDGGEEAGAAKGGKKGAKK